MTNAVFTIMVIKHIIPRKNVFAKFVCLFELVLYVSVNSYGHVGTLLPFYGNFTQNENVMTSNKGLKKNPSN